MNVAKNPLAATRASPNLSEVSRTQLSAMIRKTPMPAIVTEIAIAGPTPTTNRPIAAMAANVMSQMNE